MPRMTCPKSDAKLESLKGKPCIMRGSYDGSVGFQWWLDDGAECRSFVASLRRRTEPHGAFVIPYKDEHGFDQHFYANSIEVLSLPSATGWTPEKQVLVGFFNTDKDFR